MSTEILEALITPTIITWARERHNYSIDDLANKVGVKPEKVSDWEKGNTHPSFHQAQTMAHKLNIPFGYFYLSSPPDENLPLPDLRTIRKSKYQKPSQIFLIFYMTL